MSTNFTLHLGDCLDPVTGMASLPDKSVDVVITDPPYEIEAHTLQRRVKRAGGLAFEPLAFEPLTFESRTEIARHLARLARRWTIVFCQAEAVGAWRDAFEGAGASFRRAAIWVKPDGMPQLTGDRPSMGYESIVCAHTPGASRWNGGGRVGVYTFNKSDPVRTGHPTQKPLALMQALARDFSDPGELILDPFAGSGTTGAAALSLGRRFIGWEQNAEWHAGAVKRIANTREQPGLFGRTKQPKPKQDALAFGGDDA